MNTMLELSADDDLFSFKHNGTVYTIPAMAIEDFDPVIEMLALPHKEMILKTRDYLLDRVDDDTAAVIRSVGLKSYLRVFRAWAGMSPTPEGEVDE